MRTDEVVHVAGGWLCDQVLAGWDVTVVTADHADQRALRILGVRGRDLETAIGWPLRGVQALAIQAELYRADQRLRAMVHAIAETGQTEIRIWGDAWPDDFDGRPVPVSHRLSRAARAFKAQALAAACADARAGDTEEFHRAATGRLALV
jgi:hypothetical protein